MMVLHLTDFSSGIVVSTGSYAAHGYCGIHGLEKLELERNP
jgi:hypothetical protein